MLTITVRICRGKTGKEKVEALIFSHPVAGSLNALDMMDLANVHVDYHIRQIKDIQKHLFLTASSRKFNQKERS